MGSRTRRLVFLRLMAVVAISFMAIGHLLYSMTVGLDGYARLHMAAIAPSATSHKELQDLMSHSAGQQTAHQRRMRQKTPPTDHHKDCNTVKGGDQCKLMYEEQVGGAGKVRGSYSIKPVHDLPWDIQRLPFKDIAALNAHVRANNSSLVHVRHCPHLRLHPSVVEYSKTSTSPWHHTSRDGRSYVYSAFYDGRSSRPLGRGMGVTSPRGSVKVLGVRDVAGSRPPAFCQLWFMDDDISDVEDDVDDGMMGMSRSPLVVPVTAYPLSDPSTSRFAAFLYTCDLPTRRAPVGVSLVPEACRPPTNYLPVIRPQVAPPAPPEGGTTQGERVEFSVCVPALEEHYSNADGLLQMVEVNRMFGADRFIFYNQSTGSEVGDHLRSYVGDNLAVVLPFNAPETLQVALKGDQQGLGWKKAVRLVGANDCLYRNMFRTQYVAFLDVDELLIPRGHRKWSDMLDSVIVAATSDDTSSRRTLVSPPLPRTGAVAGTGTTSGPPAFYFKTVSFRTDRADDSRYSADQKVQRLRLTGLLKTDRELIEPLTSGRLRYVVRPLRINAVSAGGLSPITNDDGAAGLPVPESKGLVHIYRRVNVRTRLSQPLRPTVTDRVLLPYYDVILARILERHERLENPIT